jgi:nicotinamide mononucleotide transporter
MADFPGDLVAPLNHVLFTVGRDHVTSAELLGFVTGAAGVGLTVRAHVWNFPVGICGTANTCGRG